MKINVFALPSKEQDMIIKAKIAGFQFETTLDLFFLNNPEFEVDKEWLKSELLRMGDAYIHYSDAYVTGATLVLIKEEA